MPPLWLQRIFQICNLQYNREQNGTNEKADDDGSSGRDDSIKSKFDGIQSFY